MRSQVRDQQAGFTVVGHGSRSTVRPRCDRGRSEFERADSISPMRDFSDDLAALRSRLDEAAGYLRIDELRARRPQLETEASRPDLWDDQAAARAVTGELSSVTEDIERFESLESRLDDAETLYELGREEADDSVEGEIEAALASLEADFGVARAAVAVHRRVGRARRALRHPVGRGRHRRPGLGRDAPAHVPALGRGAAASTSSSTRCRRAPRPASARPASS